MTIKKIAEIINLLGNNNLIIYRNLYRIFYYKLDSLYTVKLSLNLLFNFLG